eukprot:scaffold1954_cov268-Pinguiococcus_pyrenoidosus.AAC.159
MQNAGETKTDGSREKHSWLRLGGGAWYGDVGRTAWEPLAGSWEVRSSGTGRGRAGPDGGHRVRGGCSGEHSAAAALGRPRRRRRSRRGGSALLQDSSSPELRAGGPALTGVADDVAASREVEEALEGQAAAPRVRGQAAGGEQSSQAEKGARRRRESATR